MILANAIESRNVIIIIRIIIIIINLERGSQFLDIRRVVQYIGAM
jgi:hypothetical protein